MIPERSILRLLGLQLARDARGVARPVAVGEPVQIKPGAVPAGRVIRGGAPCGAPLPSRTVRPAFFSLKEVSR